MEQQPKMSAKWGENKVQESLTLEPKDTRTWHIKVMLNDCYCLVMTLLLFITVLPYVYVLFHTINQYRITHHTCHTYSGTTTLACYIKNSTLAQHYNVVWCFSVENEGGFNKSLH